MPQNHQKINKMANSNTNKKKSTKKKTFIAVDVWQKQFGVNSVRAIRSIYAEVFPLNQNKPTPTFSQCVNALRRLEDPTYTDPVDISRDTQYTFVDKDSIELL